MKVIEFPYCCGAALFFQLYNENDHSYQKFNKLDGEIAKFIAAGATPMKEGNSSNFILPQSPGGSYERTVSGHRRSVALAITNPQETGQEVVLAKKGAKLVATFNNLNGPTLLKLWVIPLADGTDIKVGGV